MKSAAVPTHHSSIEDPAASSQSAGRRGLARIFLHRAGWSVIAAVLARATPLLAVFLVGRSLGRESVGILSLMQATAIFGGGFIGIGMGMSVARVLSEFGASHPTRARATLVAHSAATLFALGLAAGLVASGNRYVLDFFMPDNSLRPYAGLVAPFIVLTGYQYYQTGVLAGLGAFRFAAIANGLTVLLSWPLIAYAVTWGELRYVIWAVLGSGVLLCLLASGFIQRHCRASGMRASWREVWLERGLLWSSGFPCLLLNAVNPPVDWLSFQLLLQHPTGIAELGVYSAANYWCMLVLFVPLNISAAVLTLVAASHRRADSQSRNQTMWLSFAVSAIAGGVICVSLCLVSPLIMAAYGSDFAGRWPVLSWLLLAGVFLGLQVTAERILVALDATWFSFGVKIVVGVLFCLGVVALRPYGADGMAIARLASAALAALLCGLLVWHRGRRQIRSGTGPADENSADEDSAERSDETAGDAQLSNF